MASNSDMLACLSVISCTICDGTLFDGPRANQFSKDVAAPLMCREPLFSTVEIVMGCEDATGNFPMLALDPVKTDEPIPSAVRLLRWKYVSFKLKFGKGNDRSMPDIKHVSSAALELPIHASCLKMAEKAIKYRQHYILPFNNAPGVKSLTHLHACLVDRLDVTLLQRIKWNRLLTGMPTDPVTVRLGLPINEYPAVGGDTFGRMVEGDPVNTLPIETFIISYIKTLPTAPPVSSGFATLYERMPTELRDEIAIRMQPFHDAPIVCSYVLPAEFWYIALSKWGLIPWLWDLNWDVIDAFLVGRPTPDWELFARRLTQEDFFLWAIIDKQRDPKREVVFCLANRTRIWRLLMRMEFGDMRKTRDYRLAERRYASVVRRLPSA